MSKSDQEQFSVRVDRATFIPDEAAIREFVEQFNAALQQDAALNERFAEDPGTVLGECGVAFDIRRELLVASGISGADEGGCSSTCMVTNVTSCVITIVQA